MINFKNYVDRSFDFKKRIVCICGNNGVGKTNLLDAIHYLCFTKSYFTRMDGNNILHGNTGFRIEGNFNLHDKPEKAVCIMRETGKKEFLVNNEVYDKFSHHIGRFPCVFIAPDDSALITGDSKLRRAFLDAILSQLDAEYLQQLIIYQKIWQQRNSSLKLFAETNNVDNALLDVLDMQLIKPGNFIFNKRKDFLNSFIPVIKQLYLDISKQSEEVNLHYECELLDVSFAELLRINRSKDIYVQRTISGIHRDDITIQLDGKPFKNNASQGQRKSLLFAMKLAELQILNREKGFAPLLLLDDVFEKLDEDRIGNLLKKVCMENLGQVFITDTNEERIKKHLDILSVPYQLIKL